VLEGLKRCLSSFADKISKTELKPENIRPMLEKLEFSLVASDVALPVAEEICEEVAKELTGVQAPRFGDKRSLVRGALRRALLKTFETGEKVDILRLLEEKRREGEPLVILFVGVNGTGKTTTIAKLAKYLLDRHYTVLLACSDTFRAGAIEQLGEHAGRLGADPAAVAYDAVAHARARGINAVLIDTAGRMQTDKNLMEEVAKIKRVVEPDLTILTVDNTNRRRPHWKRRRKTGGGVPQTHRDRRNDTHEGRRGRERWSRHKRNPHHEKTNNIHRNRTKIRRPRAIQPRKIRRHDIRGLEHEWSWFTAFKGCLRSAGFDTLICFRLVNFWFEGRVWVSCVVGTSLPFRTSPRMRLWS